MMAAHERKITRADVIPMAEFAKVRAERRRALLPVKKLRRVEVGPHACFYFENFATMWLQVHEMLLIEKGGEEQIPGELEAYNALIPQGNELVATLMFEIDDEAQRAKALGQLGGIEDQVFLSVAGETIKGEPEGDVERTSESGKASSVHFVRFRLTPAQIAKFRAAGAPVILGFKHPKYGHMAAVGDDARAELAKDFV